LQLSDSIGVLDLQYCKDAFEEVRNQTFECIQVFSDDIQCCKENFGSIGNTAFIEKDTIESSIKYKML
jgi:hypothetical protein